MHPELTREGDIPRWFIQRALFVRTAVVDDSLNAIQEGLFRDTGVLLRPWRRLWGRTLRTESNGAP